MSVIGRGSEHAVYKGKMKEIVRGSFNRDSIEGRGTQSSQSTGAMCQFMSASIPPQAHGTSAW